MTTRIFAAFAALLLLTAGQAEAQSDILLQLRTGSPPANRFVVGSAGGFRFWTNSTLSTGCHLNAGSGTWNCTSSRLVKENFHDVDGEDLLGRIRTVPVTTWNYQDEDASVRHLGPFAEDFHAAFGLGTDERTIGLLDIAGVNFAAIQALESRTAELREARDEIRDQAAEIAELRDTVAQLQARYDQLAERIRALESQR